MLYRKKFPGDACADICLGYGVRMTLHKSHYILMTLKIDSYRCNSHTWTDSTRKYCNDIRSDVIVQSVRTSCKTNEMELYKYEFRLCKR